MSSKALRREPHVREVADVSKGDCPALGPASAPVAITVFSDFQCPYCAKFASMARKDILPAAGGNVRLVFRYFPLSMHSWAQVAAEAAACSSRQRPDYFWSFHDFFFDHQKDLTPANVNQQIASHARTLPGLDQPKFQQCISQGGGKALVERDLAFGSAHEVGATPTVFINGWETEVVAPEQLLTLIRELSPSPVAPARPRTSAPGAEE